MNTFFTEKEMSRVVHFMNTFFTQLIITWNMHTGVAHGAIVRNCTLLVQWEPKEQYLACEDSAIRAFYF